jgi:hypothetical protein
VSRQIDTSCARIGLDESKRTAENPQESWMRSSSAKGFTYTDPMRKVFVNSSKPSRRGFGSRTAKKDRKGLRAMSRSRMA